MPLCKVTPRIKKLIFAGHHRDPAISCRVLARRINHEHKLDLSKSLVQRVLAARGFRSKAGRRKEEIRLSRHSFSNCGLVFLYGLFYLAGFLPVFKKLKLPSEQKEHLRFFVRFLLDRLGVMPEHQKDTRAMVKMFFGIDSLTDGSRLDENSLRIQKEEFLGDLQEVAAYKVYFSDGFSVYIDPYLKGIWVDIGNIPYTYYLPLSSARKRLEQIIGQGVWYILASQSLDEFSPFLIRFFKSSYQKIRKIELIDEHNKVVSTEYPTVNYFNFCLGYYSEKIRQSFHVIKKEKTMNTMVGQRRYHIVDYDVEYSQLYGINRVIFRNVLIDNNKYKWGLLTNIERTSSSCGKLTLNYLGSWPEPNNSFIRKLDLINKISYNIRSLNKKSLFSSNNSLSEIALILIKSYAFEKFGIPDDQLPVFLALPGFFLKSTKTAKKIALKGMQEDIFAAAVDSFNESPIFFNSRKIFLRG